jgi:hypothetical protein
MKVIKRISLITISIALTLIIVVVIIFWNEFF